MRSLKIAATVPAVRIIRETPDGDDGDNASLGT